jgi:hypothetical protein
MQLDAREHRDFEQVVVYLQFQLGTQACHLGHNKVYLSLQVFEIVLQLPALEEIRYKPRYLNGASCWRMLIFRCNISFALALFLRTINPHFLKLTLSTFRFVSEQNSGWFVLILKFGLVIYRLSPDHQRTCARFLRLVPVF